MGYEGFTKLRAGLYRDNKTGKIGKLMPTGHGGWYVEDITRQEYQFEKYKQATDSAYDKYVKTRDLEIKSPKDVERLRKAKNSYLRAYKQEEERNLAKINEEEYKGDLSKLKGKHVQEQEILKGATKEEKENYYRNLAEKQKMEKMGTTAYLMEKEREKGNYKDEKVNTLQTKANEVVKGMAEDKLNKGEAYQNSGGAVVEIINKDENGWTTYSIQKSPTTPPSYRTLQESNVKGFLKENSYEKVRGMAEGRGTDGKAIDFNKKDDTFKYNGSYTADMMERARKDSVMVEKLGTKAVEEIKSGRITTQEQLNKYLDYGRADGVSGYGYGYETLSSNRLWNDDLYNTEASKEIGNQAKYWREKTTQELNNLKNISDISPKARIESDYKTLEKEFPEYFGKEKIAQEVDNLKYEVYNKTKVDEGNPKSQYRIGEYKDYTSAYKAVAEQEKIDSSLGIKDEYDISPMSEWSDTTGTGYSDKQTKALESGAYDKRTATELRKQLKALEPYTQELQVGDRVIVNTGGGRYGVRNKDDYDDPMTDYSAYVYGFNAKSIIERARENGIVVDKPVSKKVKNAEAKIERYRQRKQGNTLETMSKRQLATRIAELQAERGIIPKDKIDEHITRKMRDYNKKQLRDYFK